MSKQSRSNKKRTSQNIRVEANSIRTLRTLSNNEGFHFYENINKPTGQSANSLNEFLEKIKSIELQSLVFHLGRNDFSNWIADKLEDPTLARRIQMIPKENNNELRTKMQATIETRLRELENNTVPIVETSTMHALPLP